MGRRGVVLAAGVVFAVVAMGADSCGSASTEGPKPAARLHLVKARSWCRQDEIVGNVDVQVAFKNTGTEKVGGISVLPIREYASGREVRPIGDAMVDITVPADGKVHTSWQSYGVGAGETIAGCRVKVIVGGYRRSGDEQPIRVRGAT